MVNRKPRRRISYSTQLFAFRAKTASSRLPSVHKPILKVAFGSRVRVAGTTPRGHVCDAPRAGARHFRPLRFDLARPFPQLSNAWFFDRGVIWSEGSDQPAELGSPTAIGNFRDTDRSDSFSAGLAPQPQRFDLPKFRDNFLRAASLSCHSHVLVRIKSAPLRGTVLLTAYRPGRTRLNAPFRPPWRWLEH